NVVTKAKPIISRMVIPFLCISALTPSCYALKLTLLFVNGSKTALVIDFIVAQSVIGRHLVPKSNVEVVIARALH
ncbi:hypothetical protein, partial [Pseudoalteromonas piscicida]|uniref:hypothetical protein n=1 Tax=Pseudoalteromonas piscicida TaxID=43662 RepID=UPI001BB0F1EF